MEPKPLPFSRIRLPRVADPRTFTAQEHQATFLIAYAEPAYPAEAKLNHIEGTVILDAIIDKEGIIQTLSVREGDPVLAESALESVRHWAFRPTKVNGIPVEVATQLEVIFALPNPTSSG